MKNLKEFLEALLSGKTLVRKNNPAKRISLANESSLDDVMPYPESWDILDENLNEVVFKKLGIVVGHTAKSSGAELIDGTSEYIYNSQIAKKIVQLGPAYGFEVKVFFRDVGGLEGAHSEAAAWGAKAVIELHFNYSTPVASGSEVLCIEKHEKFASIVANKIKGIFSDVNRGVKVRVFNDRGYYNVNRKIPTVLPEPFFGNNREENRKAHDPDCQIRYAKALLEGAKEFLG
jgi:N-acetylmuramoyl-L-alanine amidase